VLSAGRAGAVRGRARRAGDGLLRGERAASALALALAAAVAALALAAAAPAQARTLAVREEGALRFREAQASALIDEGAIRGTLPGYGRVRFVYNGSPSVSATFTIRTARGTIAGRASARLHNPSSPTPSFRGALRITGGSGRYAHARGAGELFGVFHRHGYALSFQAVGRLGY
jgi:hypothetical protein